MAKEFADGLLALQRAGGATAGMEAPGELPRGAGGGERAGQAAAGASDEAAEELARHAFDGLRREAEAGLGEKFLPIAGVARVPSALADPIHKMALHREDGAGGGGLRQQFERRGG